MRGGTVRVPRCSFLALTAWVLKMGLQLDPSPTHTLASAKPPSQSAPVKSRDGNRLWRVSIQLMQGCLSPLSGWVQVSFSTGSCGPRCGQWVTSQRLLHRNTAQTVLEREDLHSALPAALSPKGYFYRSKHNLCATRDQGRKQSSAIFVCHASCPRNGLTVVPQNWGLQNIKIWPNIKPKLRGQLKMCWVYIENTSWVWWKMFKNHEK